MAINKNADYSVLNYGHSPVAVSTKHENFIIPAGTREEPSIQVMSYEDIQWINNTSTAFRNGILRFDPDYEEELYKALPVRGYQDILTDQEIEDIMLHPTEQGLTRILSIEDPTYFNRVYGVYLGMVNAGYGIPGDVSNLMRGRYRECVQRKRQTAFRVKPRTVDRSEDVEALKAQNDEMAQQLAALQKQMDDMKAAGPKADTEPESVPKAKPARQTRKRTTKTAASPEK